VKVDWFQPVNSEFWGMMVDGKKAQDPEISKTDGSSIARGHSGVNSKEVTITVRSIATRPTKRKVQKSSSALHSCCKRPRRRRQRQGCIVLCRSQVGRNGFVLSLTTRSRYRNPYRSNGKNTSVVVQRSAGIQRWGLWTVDGVSTVQLFSVLINLKTTFLH